MPLYEIRHRWNASILFSVEAGSSRLAVEAAVRTGTDLGGANLHGANLHGANLRGANLRGANLRGANLGDADLGGANLGDADLGDANLGGANLRGADLDGANLRVANLRGANLGGADLRGANLQPIRDDLWAVLSAAPAEVPALREALIAGKIDGSTYTGACACLVGTLAKARGCAITDFPDILPDADRLIERWFTNLRPGDTPDTSPVAAQTLAWVDTWLGNMRAAFGAVHAVTQKE